MGVRNINNILFDDLIGSNGTIIYVTIPPV